MRRAVHLKETDAAIFSSQEALLALIVAQMTRGWAMDGITEKNTSPPFLFQLQFSLSDWSAKRNLQGRVFGW